MMGKLSWRILVKMSEFEVGPTAVAGIMLTGVFVVAVVMAGIAFGNSVSTQIEDLNMISERSALHMVEECLKNGKEHLDYDNFMKDNQGKELCSVCPKICKLGVLSAKVAISDDAGSGSGSSSIGGTILWKSRDYTEPLSEEEAHEIFVNIEKEAKIIIGKLTLKVI